MKLAKAPVKTTHQTKSHPARRRFVSRPSPAAEKSRFPELDENNDELFRELVDRLWRDGQLRGHAL